MSSVEYSRAASSSSTNVLPPPRYASSAESSQRHKIPFLQDAEDLIHKKPTRITRQNSCHELGKGIYDDEALEIKNRSCHLWTCISRKPNPRGGYIYRFRAKSEYDYVAPADYPTKLSRKAEAERINEEIYPGLEISPHIALGWDVNIFDNKKFLIKNLSCELTNAGRVKNTLEDPQESEICFVLWAPYSLLELMELGYRGELITKDSDDRDAGVYIELPDRNALLANWKLMQEKHPELPDLDIAESDGIAGDMEFIHAFLAKNGLLSTGVEFLHDHTVHISRILTLIFSSEIGNSPSYKRYKFQTARSALYPLRRIWVVENEIKNPHLRISQRTKQKLVAFLPKIKGALGHYIDLITSFNEYYTEIYQFKDPQIPFQIHLNSIWYKFDDRRTYWKKRFGIKKGEMEGLLRLWDLMEKIETSWLLSRKTHMRKKQINVINLLNSST